METLVLLILLVVGNPDLQWETSSKYDVGIELGLFKNRFNFTADWFLNDIDNLVLNVPQPFSAGLVGSYDLTGGTIPQNIGKLNNRGIELSLSGSIVKSRDFSWDFNVNYSKVKNKITTLYNVGGVPVANISRVCLQHSKSRRSNRYYLWLPVCRC